MDSQDIEIKMTEKSDGSLFGKRRFDLGDTCYAEICCVDKEDTSVAKKQLH